MVRVAQLYACSAQKLVPAGKNWHQQVGMFLQLCLRASLSGDCCGCGAVSTTSLLPRCCCEQNMTAAKQRKAEPSRAKYEKQRRPRSASKTTQDFTRPLLLLFKMMMTIKYVLEVDYVFIMTWHQFKISIPARLGECR